MASSPRKRDPASQGMEAARWVPAFAGDDDMWVRNVTASSEALCSASWPSVNSFRERSHPSYKSIKLDRDGNI